MIIIINKDPIKYIDIFVINVARDFKFPEEYGTVKLVNMTFVLIAMNLIERKPKIELESA